MSDGYRKQRTIFGNYGGSLLVTPFVGSKTLVPLRGADKLGGAYQIYVQRVHVHVSTPQAGVTWNVQDSNGNSLTGAISTAQTTTTVGDLQGVPTQDPIAAEFDFGPEGIALSPGSTLNFVASGTGASGVITWDAYQRLQSDNTAGFGA